MPIGQATTPTTNKTLKRQLENKFARKSLWWGILNLGFAVFCYFEIIFASVVSFFGWSHPALWYILYALTVLFTFNFVVDLIYFLVRTVHGIRHPVELTQQERELLGVKNNAFGFKTVTPKPRVPSAPSSLSSTPTGVKPPSAYLYPTPPSGNITIGTSAYGSAFGSFHSPPSSSPNFFTSHGSPGNRGLSTPQQSSVFNRSGGLGFNTPSPNQSDISLSRTDLNGSFGSNGMVLRSRRQSSPANRSSPLTAENTISDMQSLNSYIRTQEEKERNSVLGNTDISPSGSPSFFAFNRSASDFTYLLGKHQYQLASRSPQSPSLRKDDDPDYPAKYAAREVWIKVGVNPDELERWVANLRKWLAEAVFAPVVKVIDKLNKQLHRVGHGDLQIGESSVTSLKQVAMIKHQQLPNLNLLLPYLELCTNQEYLVQRIRDLGRGGYVNEFRWDKGGDYKNKKWEDSLPSDSAIVMHMFCTFMDSQLPPHPKYPDNKAFTSQHFMKVPDKPDLKKDNILMFQTKVNPPHYKVILQDDTWDMPKGRNNMFQSILFFLHHIKRKHHGLLGFNSAEECSLLDAIFKGVCVQIPVPLAVPQFP